MKKLVSFIKFHINTPELKKKKIVNQKKVWGLYKNIIQEIYYEKK